jgi:FtsH-binding integral membrane protein
MEERELAEGSQVTFTQEQVVSAVSTLTMRAFGWMTAALMITAVVAMFTASTPGLRNYIYSSPQTWIVLVVAQVALVLGISWGISRMSSGTATVLFVVYSALMGLTLSWVFLAYELGSVATTFFVTAAMFGAACFYGYATRTDLSSWGGLLLMALIGLVLASVMNFFFASNTLYWITTYAGVLIFVGLAAYDVNRIRQYAMVALVDPGAAQKLAILAALGLYLDFVNLMLFMLRFLGRSK